MFEYVTEVRGEIQLKKYSFHWQKKDGTLAKRWDNAPHYPALPNAPHHIHLGNQAVQANDTLPSILSILDEIEQELSRHE